MTKSYKFTILFFSVFLFNTLDAKTLTMGYKLAERQPFIGNEKDNSGIYYDLFSKAAKKMNIDLKIVRLPKKRILQGMKKGTIDFYPGFTLTQERTSFAYFLENGLKDEGTIGLSLLDFPLINNFEQLKGKSIFANLGGSVKEILSNENNIKINSLRELDIKKAIKLLRLKRYDLYIYDAKAIKYYLKLHNIQDLKIHPTCCSKAQAMYIGFSRESKHFKESENKNFNKNKKVSISNFTTTISKDSLAYKFYKTLKEMKNNKETQKILNKY